MVTEVQPISPPGSDDSAGKLFTACREIVAKKGFRALSLRAAVRASGWTMGEIAYRIGSKDDLIEAYLQYERTIAAQCNDTWQARLANVSEFDGPILTAVVEAVLDDTAAHHGASSIMWHEAMLEAANGAFPNTQVAGWISDRRSHWQGVLRGRHPHGDILGQIIADYIAAEQIYSAVLPVDPEYRLIRSACIFRLCNSRTAANWSDWETFLPPYARPFKGLQTPTMGRQAKGVAQAAAQLIVTQGPSAVTHRSVAMELGQSPSAVSHHFGGRIELMSAGFDSLYHGVQSALGAQNDEAPGGDLGNPLGIAVPGAIGLVRAMHIIALVGARDPTFVPLMLEERSSRGRLMEAWYGEHLIGAYRGDRLLLQIIALVAGHRTLASALQGQVTPGGNRETLAAMLAVMG